IDKSHIPSLRDGGYEAGLAFSTNIPSLRDGLFRGNLLTGKHRRVGARPGSTLPRTTPPQTIFAETHAVRLYIAANIPLFWRGQGEVYKNHLKITVQTIPPQALITNH
ncbi:MAG: hypothetical protein LBD59_00065, partial [Prevotellaceae bacterium]|nr:hypothetical protein [Prevotellaceae bacterium]